MRIKDGVNQRYAFFQMLVQVAALKDTANEGVAVCVGAAAGQAKEQVARLHVVQSGQEAGLVDKADDGSGDVAGAGRVDAGHFGGFAAEEGAASARQASAIPRTTAATFSGTSLSAAM